MGCRAAAAYLERLRTAAASARTRHTGTPSTRVARTSEQTDVADALSVEALLALGRALNADMKVVTDLILDPADDAAVVVAAVARAEALLKPPTRTAPPIRLQERDLDMLHTLGTARMLTAQGLEWLHYPGWRARYRAHYGRLQQGQPSVYQVLPHLYQRLAAMRAAGWIQRITRAVQRASTAYRRLPDVYVLAAAGAELLGTYRGLAREAVWVEDIRTRSIQNLEHSVAIGQLYAALRAAVGYRPGITLTDWQGDHLLARPQTYDRLPVPGQPEPLPVQPDATCRLLRPDGCQRVFVEVDQGTRPLATWQTKIAAYAAYVDSPHLAARYATTDFVLLIIAPTQHRLTRIAEEVIKVVRVPADRYRFLVAEQVHPTTIRAHWQQIAQVRWTAHTLPQGSGERPQVTLQPRPLWDTG